MDNIQQPQPVFFNPQSVNDVMQATLEQKKDFVERTLRSCNRPGMENILAYLNNSDFYYAPSSEKHHCNYAGGLLDHSIMVYIMAMKLRDSFLMMKPDLAPRMTPETIAICTLLHDLCKCCYYVPKEKYTKDAQDHWKTYNGYEISDPFPIGHGEKSVILIMQIGLTLDPEEMLAIRYHMGAWDGSATNPNERHTFHRAIEMSPLVVLVQLADYSSSSCFEIQIDPKL